MNLLHVPSGRQTIHLCPGGAAAAPINTRDNPPLNGLSETASLARQRSTLSLPTRRGVPGVHVKPTSLAQVCMHICMLHLLRRLLTCTSRVCISAFTRANHGDWLSLKLSSVSQAKLSHMSSISNSVSSAHGGRFATGRDAGGHHIGH